MEYVGQMPCFCVPNMVPVYVAGLIVSGIAGLCLLAAIICTHRKEKRENLKVRSSNHAPNYH